LNSAQPSPWVVHRTQLRDITVLLFQMHCSPANLQTHSRSKPPPVAAHLIPSLLPASSRMMKAIVSASYLAASPKQRQVHHEVNQEQERTPADDSASDVSHCSRKCDEHTAAKHSSG
ncbi:hypothetical protein, partial [Litorimonas sp.]|uniref:hypothetical protein n=1 Tax=Litorimonas sp. TaxID=1892381 RepID=UPI003A8967B6